MKITARHTWIATLMIISQIMLTAFIVKWIIGQYHEEKKILEKKLLRLYTETQGEVIDTLLVQRVILPALSNDSISTELYPGTSMITIIESDSIIPDNQYLQTDCQSPPANAMIAVRIDDSIRMASDTLHDIIRLHAEMDDMLIRSVKLFMHHSGELDSLVSNSGVFYNNMIDTGLFKELYGHRVTEDGHDFILNWIEDHSTDSFTNPEHGFIISTDIMDIYPFVVIEQYHGYLLRNISPQIIFALLLLLVTGSAFYISYRSLKKQILLNRIRNDFVSNITHELKTPVSTIKVALEALQNFDMKKDPAVAEEYLKMSTMEMNRLEGLIGKVLNHSILEESIEVINPENTNVIPLIEDTIESLKIQIKEKRAIINFNHRDDNVVLRIDSLYCQGIIMNMIDNSIKYNHGDPVININLWQDDSDVYVEISDNGPGIPPEYIGKIFDKFFRVPVDNKHNIKGYGLGLSFADLVMKHHKGSIMVKNLPEGGCVFTLKFPKGLG